MQIDELELIALKQQNIGLQQAIINSQSQQLRASWEVLEQRRLTLVAEREAEAATSLEDPIPAQTQPKRRKRGTEEV